MVFRNINTNHMKLTKFPLLPAIIIAVILGILASFVFPDSLSRVFVTINSIFGNFLGLVIPLIILGLVAPGIAELGHGAGKLLAITAGIAYLSTIISGFFSYFSCSFSFPYILTPDGSFGATVDGAIKLTPYFTIDMPPIMGVTTALIIAFVIGLGICAAGATHLKNAILEFRELINIIIQKIIIPFLPLYIFGIFLQIGAEGQAAMILKVFIKVIAVIFVLHVLLLLFQFSLAGIISKKNPFKALVTMMPAYMTALGTQSSAATIPVTLEQSIKCGVNPKLAGFVIPLCATIHLAGSILKIVACAYAITYMMGMPSGIDLYSGFIFMLGITMVAAPGVPGGAIMAALGVLSSMLGFDDNMQGLMIALYITMDCFGTACNVTGDGAIALIMNRIHKQC